MIVVPFRAEHMQRIEIQDAQVWDMEFLQETYPEALEHGSTGFTAIDNRVVLASAGVIPLDLHRAMAWAHLSKHAGPHMRGITRAVRLFLDTCEFKRVEAYISETFPAGRRWISMLGFNCETPEPMRNFFANGNGAFLYSRVKTQWQ